MFKSLDESWSDDKKTCTHALKAQISLPFGPFILDHRRCSSFWFQLAALPGNFECQPISIGG
jgi:hypothetical protein